MDESKLIYPIRYIKGNECPKCGSELHLIDTDVTISRLDIKGKPLIQDTYNDLEFRCSICKEVYKANRKGQYYYIEPTTEPIIKIMKDYNPFQI